MSPSKVILSPFAFCFRASNIPVRVLFGDFSDPRSVLIAKAGSGFVEEDLDDICTDDTDDDSDGDGDDDDDGKLHRLLSGPLIDKGEYSSPNS